MNDEEALCECCIHVCIVPMMHCYQCLSHQGSDCCCPHDSHDHFDYISPSDGDHIVNPLVPSGQGTLVPIISVPIISVPVIPVPVISIPPNVDVMENLQNIQFIQPKHHHKTNDESI